MEARARTGSDWSHAHVGLLAWDFFMIHCHLDPRRHIRLWHDEGSRLVGYAMVGDDRSSTGRSCRSTSGRGSRTRRWPGRRPWWPTCAATTRCSGAGPWYRAPGRTMPARIAFLEEHGWRYRGEFAEVDMIRSLDGADCPRERCPPGS